MATINEGNGRYKASIAEVCERINQYKARNPKHYRTRMKAKKD